MNAERRNGAQEPIRLSDHFSYGRLIRFTMPTIIMMIFTSIYGVVDGLFVSNVVGKTEFAALNFVFPFIMVLGGAGFMIGTGGTALVAQQLGQGNKQKANHTFTTMVSFTIFLGAILTVIGIAVIRPVCVLLGATPEMIEGCVVYGRVTIAFTAAFMLQNVFQSFFVTAEKPHLGLYVVIAAGVTNMVLDFLFVGILGFGLAGAALATVCGEFIGGLFPIFYFTRKNSSLLRLGKTHWNGHVLLQTCINGSSELMTNLSSSIMNSLYNIQLMKFAGENGVAAYGTMMYINFIFLAIFFGYSIGSAPVISYHYGAGNQDELKNLFRKSLCLIGTWGIMLALLSQLLAAPLSKLFVGYDAELFAMTEHGFRIYCLAYLINGFNIFGSSFFTALNNGVISAAISFLRTLVFQIIMILLLPTLLGINGIWSAVGIAELMTLCVTITFFIKQRKKYHYV